MFKTILNGVTNEGNKVVDYEITVQPLREEDTMYFWEGTGTNYSVGGIEIQFRRKPMPYIIEYYVTSALFVIVSWVSNLYANIEA